jgi:NAD(P)-dependent dehydrogenase (short-subunit alcohol dehydrogenase family)
MSKLKNKVAVITGGNSGIGYATAKEFVAQGATVVITGRDEALLSNVSKELGVTGLVSDQSNLTAIGKLVEDVTTKYGKIDVLFLNAGVAAFMPLEFTDEAHFDNMYNINVKGVFFTIQKFLPILNDGGSIIFNTSANASVGMPNTSVYASTKASLLSINKVLAAELAPRKIRVNAVSPGPIVTPVYGKLGLSQEQLDGFSEVLSKKVLLNRFGQPDEIAKAVAFLASDEASYITGTELNVDGGLLVNTVVS